MKMYYMEYKLRMINKHLAFFILLFCITCNTLQAQVKERWAVKTCTDGFVIPKTAELITVAEVAKYPLAKVGNDTKRLPGEKVLITVRGKIVRHTLEKDFDIHTEVSDGTSKYSLPCEAVSPNDKMAKTSPYIKEFTDARKVIEQAKLGDEIEITGVAFFDKKHGKITTRTPNYFEIHPITSARIIKP
jgi:hypothetical protein